ncbi:leucine-rich repeat domain-containing protein [Candidatus Palauibacter irciniicola]|uniref:leucine-rich repeat domain-containing protein n=1 Tax=Candidatus Palauibacter irciniicola TaxID=3056733 RepID=UPI003B01A7DB
MQEGMLEGRFLRATIGILGVVACGESAPTQPPRPPPPPPPLPVATSITVSPPTVTLGRGGILRLTAAVSDQYGRPFSGATVTWESNDPATATVDTTGLVTGVASGETTILVTAGSATAMAAVTVEDRLADRILLIALYEATNGPAWTNRRNWASNRPLSEWYGVVVNADRRVTGLVLSQNGLGGRTPPELGNLSSLERLWLGSNNLTGPLPVELGQLSSLQSLALDRNELTGSIPAELGVLSNLEELRLDGNELTGSIPPELGNLSSLERLWLSSNNLTGPLPVELGQLSSLQSLALDRNELTGSIPAELGVLSNLEELRLDGNELTGSIPPELGNLSSLERLWLSSNNLTGPLPVELGQLSSLHNLALAGNGLTGSIPPEFGGLSSLERLWLSFNDLTGPIPPELGGLSSLRDLALNYNSLTGSIPAELGVLSALEELRLDGNDLTGPIPPELGGLSSLRDLALNYNSLTGSIPAELGVLSALEELRLDGNDLTGPIPPELGDLSNLEGLRLDDNDLEGALPSELGQLRSLTRLLLHQNALSGSVTGDLGNLTSLQVLSLSRNALSGPLPAELSGLVQLQELRLNANPELSGFLPTDLKDLGNLTTLLAEGTSLCAPADGDFLAWLGKLQHHRVARCQNDVATAYLVQAVQSRDFPVPLVANRPALLRVFPTAPDGESVDFPAVRARFYLDGEEAYTADIPSPGGTVPAEAGEGSLHASANATIPAAVLQPGLELVVEIDPDETLGATVGIARRIPESGRQAIDVRKVPPLHLTFLPVLRPGQEESGFLERVAELSADDAMFWPTRFWLPVAEFTLDVRETFFTSAATGSELLREIEAIRVMEGGPGYYMGGLPSSLTVDLGVGGLAIRPGRSSLSHLDSTTVAHELGHNMILRHAPCGGANLTDPDFPDRAGRIGAWGFDPTRFALISPETADLMSACDPSWISPFGFGQALDHRTPGEPGAAGRAERTLLVWGGTDAAGVPFLDPAFAVDAPPTLPRSEGPYTLTGRAAAGEELFSINFDMQEVAHGDGGASFVFALPVPLAWADRLKAIELSAPGGAATLDRTGGPTVAILRDPRTGRVRGILRDLGRDGDRLGSLAGVAAASAIASALPEAAGLEILVSSGLHSRSFRR